MTPARLGVRVPGGARVLRVIPRRLARLRLDRPALGLLPGRLLRPFLGPVRVLLLVRALRRLVGHCSVSPTRPLS
jgi:hypothetical protein